MSMTPEEIKQDKRDAMLSQIERGAPGERRIAYLAYDDTGMLAKAVSVKAGDDQMEANTMLLNAIEDKNVDQQKEVMKACMAACLESLNMTVVTIDTGKLSTIWDRVGVEIFTAKDQPGIVHYAIHKLGAPMSLDPFNIAGQTPEQIRDAADPEHWKACNL